MAIVLPSIVLLHQGSGELRIRHAGFVLFNAMARADKRSGSRA